MSETKFIMFAHVSLSFTQLGIPLQEGHCSLIVVGPKQSRFTNLLEGHVARMGEKWNAYRILVGKLSLLKFTTTVREVWV
jgi:hypothetical protein